MDGFITVTPELKGSAYVDAVLGVELEEYKVVVTGLNSGSSISTDALVTTTVTTEQV